MATPEEVELRQRADRALRGGRFREALTHYGALLSKVEVYSAGRYEGWLEGALRAYEGLGRAREAGLVLLGLGRFAEAQRSYPVAERPLEWALAASRLGRHAEAARVLSEAGHPALAAVELETAEAHAAARIEWERVLRDPRLAGRPYETALVHFSLGQALLRAGERAAGERALTTTQRLLEGLADDFESSGELPRALDCYRLLLRLGRDAGSFENVAEGYLNSIRILSRDDDLRYLALQYYEDFLAYAVERREWYAAATLAREAAAHSLRVGLVFDRHYLGRAVELWEATAAHNEAAGGPTDLSENALHAAIDAAASLGDHAAIARLYVALAALPVAAKKRARYQRLAGRGVGLVTPPAASPAFPDYLRRRDAYQDVSRQDLVEWELDGDAGAVLTRMAVELGPLDRKSARLALRGALLVSAPSFSFEDPRAASELARALGHASLYPVLRPLERLFEHAAPEVRAAVMDGVGNVYIPRSFDLVLRGLADPAPVVAEEALRALRRLSFHTGFEALVRIFREATDERVRATALEAIADLPSMEAGMFLLELVRAEGGPLRAAAEARLASFASDELEPAVRQALEVETGEARASLERVLKGLTAVGS